MPEFRKDPITNRWVIIATERAKRPQSNAGADQHTEAGPCPFCAGNEAMTPPAVRAYRDDSTSFDWTVRVVPNKYPALVDNGDGSLRQDGIFESMNGLGIHEVVIESPEHVVDLATLTVQRFNRCLLVYRDRMLTLRADPRWRYILVYKNQGATAGATLPHIHSQLIALPMVPPAVIEAVKSAKRYHGDTGHCLFCDIIARNTAQPTRLVAQSERFVVLSPYAPRFPYETWILPRQHGAYFDSPPRSTMANSPGFCARRCCASVGTSTIPALIT
jgi:UDPglucose--hexose-1-phosphate uridylyltransferase